MECEDLKLDHVKSYIQYLRTTGIKNVSVNTYTRAIKGFVHWLFVEELIKDDFSHNIKKLRSDAKNIVPLYGYEVQQIDALFESRCETSLRDKCIFHLMLDAGLRLGEVVNLKISSVMFDKNLISVYGKGDKYRMVIMCPALKSMLFRYMINYRNCVNDDDAFFVLLSENHSPLTVNSVKQLFIRLKKRSGITRLYPHLCRHTFATSYIMGGGNLEFLRILLGHTDYNVTKNYLHLANQYHLMHADIYKLDPVFFRSMY